MGSFGTAPKLNNNVPNDEMIERTLVNASGTILAHSTSQLWASFLICTNNQGSDIIKKTLHEKVLNFKITSYQKLLQKWIILGCMPIMNIRPCPLLVIFVIAVLLHSCDWSVSDIFYVSLAQMLCDFFSPNNR